MKKAQTIILVAIVALGLADAFLIGRELFPRDIHHTRIIIESPYPAVFSGSEMLVAGDRAAAAFPLHTNDTVCWSASSWNGNATFVFGESNQYLADAPFYETNTTFVDCYEIPYSGTWYFFLFNWDISSDWILVEYKISIWTGR